MADSELREGSDTSNVAGGSSGPTVELNVKTLDSRTYSFHVDTNMVVSAFKEKVASQTGVPVGQQRLIFSGKVLKDDLPLSEYHVETGDTFHLVERQPQPSAGSGSTIRESTPGNGYRGQDSNGGQSRNHIGHITHGVGQVIGFGSVLNSVGIGNLGGIMQHGVQAPRGSHAEGSRNAAGNQNQGGSQPIPSQAFRGQSAAHAMQIPLGAAVALPTLNMAIPDSMDTLIEFMNRMELALSQSGDQQNQSSASNELQNTTQLPRGSRGLPTVETLHIVLQRAERLLSSHVVPVLSRTAGRLDQEGGSTDPAVRGQVQTQSAQLGVAMQHLGALLLELGRAMLTLRMGQSPAESFVNAGPALYISSSGPYPIMVQPFPLQTSSLFSGLTGAAPSPVAMGPIGAGGVRRNVNVHIFTGASLAPMTPRMGNGARNGEGTQGQSGIGTESPDSTQARGFSASNATTFPFGPGVIPVSGVVAPGTDVSLVADSSPSSIIAEINSQLRRSLISMQNGQSDNLTDQVQSIGGVGDNDKISHQKDLATSGVGESSQSQLPLGVGLGGLQPKKQANQPERQTQDSDGVSISSNTNNLQAGEVGQKVLQSITGGNASTSSGPSPARQGADGQIDIADVADALSQFLENPAGVSQQAGDVISDVLRIMRQQFTQNPAMRSTVNQIAQQSDSQGPGDVISDMGSGQEGGIDLSRMMQQRMPIVSEALGGVSSAPQTHPMETMPSQSRSRVEAGVSDDPEDIIDMLREYMIRRFFE